jgi:hypothetical protein
LDRSSENALFLGDVSHSAGVPTVTVIERGSNANCPFVRLADGTQICWKLLENLGPANIVLGSFFRSAIFTLGAWPAAFIARPALTLTATGPDQAGWQHV